MRLEDGLVQDRGVARQRLDRVRATIGAYPLLVKMVLVLALLAAAVVASALPARVGDLVLLMALCYGPVAVWRKQRSVFASLGVAAWGLAVILRVASLTPPVTAAIIPLLLLPFAVVAAAHAPVLARRFVPCRTVAWTLLWTLPSAMFTWRFASAQPALNYVVGSLFAATVLGWRLVRSWQDASFYGWQQVRGPAVTVPHSDIADRATPAGGEGASRPDFTTVSATEPAMAGTEFTEGPGHTGVDELIGLAHRAATAPPILADALCRAAGAAARHLRHRYAMPKITGVAVVLFTAVALWAAVRWPPMRYLVYAAWMMPLGELVLLAIGQAWFRYRYQEAPAGKFTQLIIQVTTVGREHERVTEIITQIRDYDLRMDHQVWVVTEPGHRSDYPLADLVLTVPTNFSARSAKKARAMEYSRLARMSMGLERGDVKILFNDDDVSLTKRYIERAFTADYDICEGIVTPRTWYAVRPFGHFAVSHADDIRTHACLVYCSVFQGILRRPLHVHGEGLTVTGEAEGLITWDIPLVASEDLAFGQRARTEGLRWGWFHEYAEVTSPWSLRDFFIQRSRWLWGDIHAITHRDVMPLGAALRVSLKYVAGALGLVCSVAGLYLRISGRIPATSMVLSWAKLSILSLVGVFFACGWIAAGSATSRLKNESRLLAAVIAVLMAPISVALTFAAILVPLFQGDPQTFRLIAKTRGHK